MKKIDRRAFLKTLGLAGATTAGLTSCGGKTEDGEFDGTVKHSDVPKDKMTYRTLNEDKISVLGYGCMRWPMIDNPDGSGKQIVDQDMVQQLIDYAMAHGITYYDTSPHYCQGQSEAAVGKAISKYPRDSYYLATKLSTFLDTCDDYMAAHKKELANSLKNLQTDYIDYYLIHGAGIGGMDALHQKILDNGALDWLLEQRKKGVIRHLGFSFHGDVEVFNYLMSRHDEIHWDFVQIQMNYSDWKHATGWNTNAEYLYNELTNRKIPVVIMEPLLGGRLAKLPTYLAKELKARRPEESLASWAFRFCGSHENVMAVLSGMTYMENLQDNLCTFSPLDPCTQEEYDLLEHTAVEYLKNPIIECNSCGYCMPCPYGLDIPTILTYYNKLVNEQMMADSVNDPDYKERRRAFLIGYDRAVPKVRQANHCIGCNQCRAKCPQWIDIAGSMQRIDKYVEALKQDNLGLEPEKKEEQNS